MQYYTYQVTENTVDGYETAVTYDTATDGAEDATVANGADGSNEYTATITNTHRPLLPFTGGPGVNLLLLLGLLLVLAGLAVAIHKTRKNMQDDAEKLQVQSNCHKVGAGETL